MGDAPAGLFVGVVALRVAVLALSAKVYGASSYLRSILPEFARHRSDAEFMVLVPNGGGAVSEFAADTVRLVRMAMPMGGAWSRTLIEQFTLPRTIASLGADVIYTASNIALFRGALPCVIAVRNMEPLVPSIRGSSVEVKARLTLLRALTRASLKRATRVVAVSNFVKQSIVAKGCHAEKVDVIYHGIDDQERPDLTADNRDSSSYAFCVAKFARYANLETLFRAFAHMRDQGYRGELRFAGGGWDRRYEAEMIDLIKALGIQESVRILGYIPRERVQEMMRNCDVFLFPSTLEACPFTLLEAMNQGAPIVATTAQPMPEFGGESVAYVDPLDHKQFAETALNVASKRELRDRLRQGAWKRASCFRWDDSVSKLITTLRRAAAA